MMTDRRIAILVDGSFFLRRLSKLIPENRCDTPIRIVACLRRLCRTHVSNLTGIESDDKRWHRHIYRSFYYDARPYDGKAHHPLTNRAIDFAKSNLAREREALFHQLRRHPKLALRLGKVSREDDWTIHPKLTKRILKSIELIAPLEALGSAPRDQAIPASEALTLTADEAQKLR